MYRRDVDLERCAEQKDLDGFSRICYDKSMITEIQVQQMLRMEIALCGSAGKWALKKDVSSAYISDVLRGRRDPGDKILRALGLRKIVGYELVSDPPATVGRDQDLDAVARYMMDCCSGWYIEGDTPDEAKAPRLAAIKRLLERVMINRP